MKTKTNELIFSPLNIPERKIGRYQIKHEHLKAGAEVTIVSLRNSLFYGVPSCKAILPRARIIHKLIGGNGVMMTDSPQENFMMMDAVKKAHGHVLIGGLGLGYFPTALAKDVINGKNKKVKSITVVEINKDVIKLTAPYLPKRVKVIHKNLYLYLNSGKAKFDYAYIDIWYPTGESVWSEHIVPLRRLIYQKYGKKDVECWGEKEMQGQITMGVLCRPQMEALTGKVIRDNRSDLIKHAFYKARNTIVSFPETPRELIDRACLNKYFNCVGSEEWEKLFKWDIAVKEHGEWYKECMKKT